MVKAAVKKGPARKPASKEKTKGGDKYICEICGLAVSVDQTCGCAEACDLVCCGTPMKRKAARS